MQSQKFAVHPPTLCATSPTLVGFPCASTMLWAHKGTQQHRWVLYPTVAQNVLARSSFARCLNRTLTVLSPACHVTMFRTRCMLFYFAKTIVLVSWGNMFPSCLHLFLTFQQPNPFCCNRSTTNLFMISFLSRTIDFFSYSFWAYGFICGWPRPVSSRSARQPSWRSTPHCNHCHVNTWSWLTHLSMLAVLCRDSHKFIQR